jgi:hypothetical protein
MGDVLEWNVEAAGGEELRRRVEQSFAVGARVGADLGGSA